VVAEVDREQVLAYRVAAQGLDRAGGRPDPAVLDLGVQDTPYGSARLALAARTEAPVDEEALALVWAARGAPHLHRRADLPGLAAALWPLSDADATGRISYPQIKEGSRLGVAAFTATAEALRAAVTASLPKGEVSRAVSDRVPASLTYWCGPCDARHVSGGLLQQAGLAGGVRLEPRGTVTTLTPIHGWPGVPAEATGTESLVRAYVRLLGPARPADVAKYLGVKQTVVRQVWPDGLAEVRVGGRSHWLPPDRLDALRSAPSPRLVRLLPPSDMYLQPHDRDLLLPDSSRQAEVWRVLGNPGALLVDGEIAGVWRARKTGRAKLEITVTAFGALPGRVHADAEAEAHRVAAVQGAADLIVRFAG
jgi:hypothetical protein